MAAFCGCIISKSKSAPAWSPSKCSDTSMSMFLPVMSPPAASSRFAACSQSSPILLSLLYCGCVLFVSSSKLSHVSEEVLRNELFLDEPEVVVWELLMVGEACDATMETCVCAAAALPEKEKDEEVVTRPTAPAFAVLS